MNHWVNDRCIAAMALKEGDRVVDFGSGLGSLTERMAEIVAPDWSSGRHRTGRTATCRRGATVDTATTNPIDLSIVRALWKSLRWQKPSGAILTSPMRGSSWSMSLARHGSLATWCGVFGQVVASSSPTTITHCFATGPNVPVWTRSGQPISGCTSGTGTTRSSGGDLVQLLHGAGAKPVRNDWIFFGSCSGSSEWTTAVDNLVGVMRTAEEQMIRCELIDKDTLESAFGLIAAWKNRPDARAVVRDRVGRRSETENMSEQRIRPLYGAGDCRHKRETRPGAQAFGASKRRRSRGRGASGRCIPR